MKTEEQHDYPSEVITLPSQGYFYPEDSPLSDGTIELKYMTAKEEDILTSQNLIKRGVVFDRLLESVILSPINIDDLLTGDKNAITVTTRILGYGNRYNVKYTCRDCGEQTEVTVNLNKLETKEVDYEEMGLERGKNEFEYVLPKSNVSIKWKLLTHGDEQKIREEIQSLNKIDGSVDHSVTTRLKHIITEVNGSREQGEIRSFVDNRLLSIDSFELRSHIEKISPDIDLKHEYKCSKCGHGEVLGVPLGIGFFWPKARK